MKRGILATLLVFLGAILGFCILTIDSYSWRTGLIGRQNRQLTSLSTSVLESNEIHMQVWLPNLQADRIVTRKCKEILINESTVSMPRLYQEEISDIKKMFEDATKHESYYEGHSEEIKEETQMFHMLARQSFVRTVCEIGFNAGHGTLVWLTSNLNIRVYSFDLGEHGYTRPAAEHLQRRFPDRLFITYGDSTKTVPEFTRRILQINPNFSCDIILVDGGHTYSIAKADLVNMAALANKDNHILIFDDYPSSMFKIKDLGRAWEELKGEGRIAESFSCLTKDRSRGFTLGRYLR